MAVRDPFSLALGGSDSDTDNASPTFVARSPEKAKKHGEVVEIDDSQVDAVLAEASVAAEVADDSFATPKQGKRKAARELAATSKKGKTKGKTKAGLDRQRVHDDGMDLMLTATKEADAPDVKCVFVPRLQKKIEEE